MLRNLWWRIIEAYEALEDRLFGAKDDEVIGFEYEPGDEFKEEELEKKARP